MLLTLALVLGAAASAVSYRVGHRLGGERVAAKLERRQLAATEAAVNVIDGVVLPEPDDPRWTLECRQIPDWLKAEVSEPEAMRLIFRLGELYIWQDSSTVNLLVGREGQWSFLGHRTSEQQRQAYYHAVDKAWIGRRALEQIVAETP